MNLDTIENHFRNQQAFLGNLADTESFTMIFSLIDQVKKYEADIDRLTSLNRHYFHRFYNGSIEKMQADFKYIDGA